jgi:hypothetical protein
MRRQLLCFAILVAAAEAHAFSPPEQEKGGVETAAEVRSDNGERVGRKSPAPATTFTPTETIDADSAVSFPVDI